MPAEPRELFTIGVYGFSEEEYFDALRGAGIDTFCDLRARRGLRGSTFAFANSKRLQARLSEMGIRYRHFPELAAPEALRARQHALDRAGKVAKRRRAQLSDEFVEGYVEQCLSAFDSSEFVRGLGEDARRIVLFCVEREPEACHRSLVAGRLERDLGVEVRHLLPPT